MAGSAGQLGEAHRQAQHRLGATVVASALATWKMLDPGNVDAGTAHWLAVNGALIQSAKRQSARMTANYYVAARKLHAPGKFVPVLAEDTDDDQVRTSLLVTGPYRLKRNTGLGGVQASRALDIAMASSAAAAMRLALQGGRDTLTGSVKADRLAIGYVRVTSGNACAFCSDIAGEGTVFGEDAVDFQAHDGCSCSGSPVFG